MDMYCVAVLVLALLAQEVGSFALLRSLRPLRQGAFNDLSMMSGGFSISSATIFARDLEKTSRFLIDTIGFDSVDNGSQEGKVTLKLNADCVIALQQLTNVKSDGKMVDNGFIGFGITKMAKDATNIMQKVKDSESGSVSMELDDYKYGAAMLPDEDEMKQFPVRYGIVTDSNGYRVEVQETQKKGCKIVMGALDLDKSIKFYTNVLGMKLYRKRADLWNEPKKASMSCYLGYGESENEPDSVYLELVYKYATEKINHGLGFSALTIKSPDQALMMEALTEEGLEATMGPDGIISTTDPSGYRIAISKSS